MSETDNKTQNTVPSWLQQDLFEEVLKNDVSGYKKIKNFKTVPAMAAGENYATIMLRVEIDVDLDDRKEDSISYMIKVPHNSAVYRDMIKTTNLFEIERGMYMEVVPEFVQMYREAGVELQFAAKSYKINAPDDYVLLQDLRQFGFKNANRLNCLDMEHMHCVLKKLAQWHAATATRVETKGEYADTYKISFLKEAHVDLLSGLIDGNGKILLELLSTYKGHEVYEDALRKYVPQVLSELYKTTEVDPNEFNALNHGDCWSNNIMFQYDNKGNIKETYFVDYQVPKYGAVAQDLVYFILTSAKLELKLTKFDYFIKFYHDHLIKYLKLLGYPKQLPTLKEIHMQLYKYSVWCYHAIANVLGAVLLQPSENSNFDNFVGDSEQGIKFKKDMFSNPKYREHMEMILPWLYYRGGLSV